ncbi:MAG: hypothetical protein LBS81_00315 [Endomicrobium sp.]|jgi:hypothetical protein|nr:hypothetical protein [Endomicrobium sp.]
MTKTATLYPVYGTTIYSTIAASALKLKSNSLGEYTLVNNLYLHLTDNGFSINKDRTHGGNSEGDGYFKAAGSVVKILR